MSYRIRVLVAFCALFTIAGCMASDLIGQVSCDNNEAACWVTGKSSNF